VEWSEANGCKTCVNPFAPLAVADYEGSGVEVLLSYYHVPPFLRINEELQ